MKSKNALERLGVVTGLAAEARCFPPDIAALHGVGAKAAHANATALSHRGRDILISAGLAGGLAPDCPCGGLVIGQSILSAGQPPIPCDIEITDCLAEKIGGDIPVIRGPIFSADTIIATPEDKNRLHRETGACAVDMESYAVARAARQTGKSFVALRVIADDAGQAVPPSAQAAIAGNAGIRIAPLLAQLARRPGEIVELIRLAGRTRRALRTLRSCGDVLIDGLTL